MDASVHVLNIYVLSLGQWISMEFDRAGVSSGVGLGAREAEQWGSRLTPSLHQSTLACIVVMCCSPMIVCFKKY